VPGGAAAQDDDAADASELIVHPGETAELDRTLLLEEPPTHRFAEGLGCSMISLSMKWGYPPRSTSPRSHSTC
jgi:hypothetical protein